MLKFTLCCTTGGIGLRRLPVFVEIILGKIDFNTFIGASVK